MYVMICDDNPVDCRLCGRQLTALSRKRQIPLRLQTVHSGEELLFVLEDHPGAVDLVILDYHMRGISGFETAQQIRAMDEKMDIVFFSVDESKVFQAFDVDALHFVVKNQTSFEQLEKIFIKAAQRVDKRRSELLLFQCAGEHRSVPVGDIRYFEVRDKIVTVYYGQEQFEFYTQLSRLEESLAEKGFVRIHKSYLVNERYVQRASTAKVTLSTGESLPVGRSYAANSKHLSDRE